MTEPVLTFEECLAMYISHRLSPHATAEELDLAMRAYYAGCLGGVTVMMNRISKAAPQVSPEMAFQYTSIIFRKASQELLGINNMVRMETEGNA